MFCPKLLSRALPALGAVGIFPNPIAESIFQLLLLFTCGNRLRLIHDLAAVFVLIVGGGSASVQRLLDQFRSAEASSTMRDRIA